MKLQSFKIFILIFLIFNLKANAQKIEELESQLMATYNLDSVRMLTNELFKLDKYNFTAIQYAVSIYEEVLITKLGINSSDEIKELAMNKNANYKDSIDLFFQNLIDQDSLSPIPLILTVELKFRSPYIRELGNQNIDSLKIPYLKKAVKLDSNNSEANYLLSRSYYNLLNSQYAKNPQSPYLQCIADEAYQYLERAYNIDANNNYILKYPLHQLANYLNKPIETVKYNKSIESDDLYFPIESFTFLPPHWESDFSFNVLNNIEWADFSNQWYSGELRDIGEEIIYNKKAEDEIYRVSIFNSFINSIVIRFEKKGNKYYLNWTEFENGNGNNKAKIINQKSNILPQEDWLKFEKCLNSINYLSLNSYEEADGFDGYQIIIEYKSKNKYKVVDRWTPMRTGYQGCADYLLKLTDYQFPPDYVN